MVLTDDLGRTVTLPEPPRRVMALAPSLTEMLFFVCDPGQVVAVTQNDNFPAAVNHKPVVNTYPMDFEGLLMQKPDLVFTTDGMTSLADAERIGKMGIPVYYQTYQTVEDVLTGILDIGRITGHADRATARVDSLRARLRAIEQRTKGLSRPRVLSITWTDPIYVYGKNTLLTDKLRLAGAANAVDSVFKVPYPALSREYILRLNPDVVLGGPLGRMDSTFFRLYPELKRTSAYRHRRVYRVTDDLNARPSPRVVEAVEELRSLIHPRSASQPGQR
ncbi:MAG: ABC transporter substrate-binding protein [Ferruginibacter sp.]|nr:ABC transporter substrate-binding protein [Cytophagales bacterium]